MQSEWKTRLLRGLALFIVVLAAYLSQFIFSHSSLIDLFPPNLIEWMPALSRYMRWRTDGLMAAALWLYLLAALGFGLLVPLWRGDSVVDGGTHAGSQASLFVNRHSLILLAAAGSVSILAAVIFRFVPSLATMANVLIVGSAIIYLWAGYAHVKTDLEDAGGMTERIDFRPMRGWPWLAGILGLATFAYGFRWSDAPARIDRLTVEAGLWAQGSEGLPEQTDLSLRILPSLAITVSTIGARVSGDGLLGVRFAGLYAGLLLVLAVWLLGGELLSRAEVRGAYGEVLEDDGLITRVLATTIAAFGLPLLFFARAPVILEGIAWGSLGLWALLYGFRTGLLPMIGVSAVLLGISAFFGPNGLILIAVALSIWVGVLVLRPDWSMFRFRRGSIAVADNGPYWLFGLAIILIPVIAGTLGTGSNMAAYLSLNALMDGARTTSFSSMSTAPLAMGLAASDFQRAVLAPSIASGSVGLFGIDAPMLSALIAPLYILGVGALAMNIDTITGWTLTGWLILGAALSVLFARSIAPHWTSLVVVWPAVALSTAFAFDRLRATVIQCAGGWSRQANLYFAAGLVIGASFLSWLSFYEGAMLGVDAASAVGREVRRAAKSGETVLFVSSQPWDAGELNTVMFLAKSAGDDVDWMQMRIEELPAEFSMTTRLVFPASTRFDLEAVRSQYPGGSMYVHRDIGGNPTAYSYLIER